MAPGPHCGSQYQGDGMDQRPPEPEKPAAHSRINPRTEAEQVIGLSLHPGVASFLLYLYGVLGDLPRRVEIHVMVGKERAHY